MKITVVTHDSVFGRYFARTLADACQIDRIVVETARAPSSFYWKKLRRVGPVNFAFQFWLNRWFEREGQRVLPLLEFPPHEQVSSINRMTFVPEELVVAFGTSYVASRTLAAVPYGVLNLHTGLLPYYRGVKSEFWVLRNQDFSRIGWSLHFMTPQLDAGDIVLRNTISWEHDHPAQLRTRLLRDAVPAIATLLTSMRSTAGAPPARIPQGTGAYYTTPTLRDWRAARPGWRKGVPAEDSV